MISPKLLTEPLMGASAAVARPEGTRRTSSQNPCDGDEAPASMNAVSREGLIPLDVAAGGVAPLRIFSGYERRPRSDVLQKSAHGRTIHIVASCAPCSKRVQSVLLVLHTRCSQVYLEIRGHLFRSCQRQIPFLIFLVFKTLWNSTPEPT